MKYIIKKCNKITGDVMISGSKNATLPLIACCLLTKETCVLSRVPNITDVSHLYEILLSMGVEITWDRVAHTMKITAATFSTEIVSSIVSKIRASYYLMGSAISRYDEITIALPGGCSLGGRPIDFHLYAFEKLGCIVTEEAKRIHLQKKTLQGTIIDFPKESVGATINTLLASVLAEGKTAIYHASLEPEVQDIIAFLNQMGADIRIVADHLIEITGVSALHGAQYEVTFDRMEAGSYLLLAMAVPESVITLQGVVAEPLMEVVSTIQKMGGDIVMEKEKMTLISPKTIQAVDITTGPYPHFPTDLQQMLTPVLLKAKKISVIEETIFLQRFTQAVEMQKLGAQITIDHNRLYIYPSELAGGTMRAFDLRCGFAEIIAGVIADGESTIECAEMIERGYEDVIGKLRNLHIQIEECQ